MTDLELLQKAAWALEALIANYAPPEEESYLWDEGRRAVAMYEQKYESESVMADHTVS